MHHSQSSTAPCSSLFWIFPLGKRERWTRPCSNWGENAQVSSRASSYKQDGMLTSIFLSSMALGSLRRSRKAAKPEYSMLKGSPVLPSLSSLMTLSSFWKDTLGLGWGLARGHRTTFWNLERNLDMTERGEERDGMNVGAERKLIRNLRTPVT